MCKDTVFYYSSNGTTKETVQKIRNSAKTKIRIFDIADNPILKANQEDRIFIGCGIYIGNLPGKVVKFIDTNSSVLKSKKIIFFIHGLASESNYKDIVRSAVKKHMVSGSYEIFYLGGKLDLRKKNFLIRRFMTVVSKKKNLNPNNLYNIDDKNILKLLEYFQ